MWREVLFYSCLWLLVDGSTNHTSVPRLVFTPIEEWQIMSVTVRITCPLDNVRIYYTIDGSYPTLNSLLFNSQDPIFIDTIGITTIRAFGFLEGYEESEVVEQTYNVVERCVKPVFVPNGGTFAGSIRVTLTSTTPNSIIHFTLDGSTPTESSSVAANGEILIEQTSVLKAIATRSGSAVSQVTAAIFKILPKVALPIISPATNVFAVSATLKIACSTPNATIYYTTNGEDPNESSLRIDRNMPDIILDTPGQHVVKAYATLPTMLASDIVTKTFVILMRAVPPIFDPIPGTYTGSIKIIFHCTDTVDGLIYYTTDGITTPSSSSSHVNCGEFILLSNPGKYTIRSFRTTENKAPSAFVEGVYILLRPPYDTFPVNPNSTYQMKPDYEVFVVEKNLKSTGYYESRYCSDRNIRGRLVVLHNPVGHFDILEPLTGCGSGLVLPSISGRDWERRNTNSSSFSSPTTATATSSSSINTFYRNKINTLSQQDLEKWNQEYYSTTTTTTSNNNACDVITNAGFFNITSTACFGDIVSNGKVIQTSELHNVNFGIRNGSFVIGYVDSSEIIGPNRNNKNDNNDSSSTSQVDSKQNWVGFDTLVSGLVWLVRDNEVFVSESLHPQYGQEEEDMTPQTAGSQFASLLSARTAIGYDSKGRLLILQVEGETWVRGMSLFEFATFAKELGFVSAINLDGGGSATMTVNSTLVSEPSWKCSRIKALSEYHQLIASNSRKNQKRINQLVERWNFHEESVRQNEVTLDGDGFRYCEKPVSSITCIHSLPPPSTVDFPPSTSPSQQPTIFPTSSPSFSPSLSSVNLPSPLSPTLPLPPPVPTLFPFATNSPTPSSASSTSTSFPTTFNSTFLLIDNTLLSSLTFYRMTSYGLLVALLISLTFNLVACCNCFFMSNRDDNASNRSNKQNLSSSSIEMSQPAHQIGVSPYSQSTLTQIDHQTSPTTANNTIHSTPLSVPSSNDWQSKFKSSTLEDESDEDIHQIVVSSSHARSRSPVREENDEEDATETEQFFKNPPPSSSIPPSSQSSSPSTNFFGILKSSLSKEQKKVGHSSSNWRDELDDGEEDKRSREKSQLHKYNSKNGDEGDGEYNPTSGGWLKRKKKSSKKKVKESPGDEGEDLERGGG